MTLILYFFIFSSWGIGLLAALAALSMKMQEHGVRMKSLALEIESDSLDFAGKKNLFDRIVSRVQQPMAGGGIPEELRKLMETGPDHPEVGEIEDGDDVVGVVFKAHSYPPGLDDSDDDDDNNEKNSSIGNSSD